MDENRSPLGAALALAVDASSDGVAVVTCDGAVLLANAAMERALGLRAGEPLAPTAATQLEPLLRGLSERGLSERGLSERGLPERGLPERGLSELTLRHGERTLRLSATPVSLGEGTRAGTLLLARDGGEPQDRAGREQTLIEALAAQSRATEEAQRARTQAEAASRAKSAYLANMSHELRTPLNSILGFAQLLERDRALSEQHRENLLVISKAGEHLLGLINDILEMARIEAGRATLNEADFDLHRLLGSVEEMFAVQARKKGLTLDVHRDPTLPRCVRSDEGKLRQVLINLLGNALKFTSRGRVVLRAHAATRPTDPGTLDHVRLHFEVTDTGPGIAPQEIDTLFQAFSQSQSGRDLGEGTGLGLAISRQFVNLMGGDIQVESTVGKGTTFRFDIRAALSSAAAVRATRAPRTVIGLAPGQATCRILVVDDGWQSRHLLIRLLTGLGFEVRGATNGLGAMAQFEMWEPHMIFMDMRMPLLDGYEATRRIKATDRGRATVVVGMTASAFEHNRAQVLAVGCNDFLRKPYRDHEIHDQLTQHLGVTFLYEEPRQSLPPPPPATEDQLRVAADALPAEWRAELHDAATRLDRKAVLLMLDMIRVQDPALAESLMDLVRHYRFDRILALLGPADLAPISISAEALSMHARGTGS
ncbi:ATP-binding protein [Chondromyces apiculatus]|uniref:histidine kinase n=1 Tax=Chondromyces apiculatus DSM 436 TaxID=1192034 RepID=A0A017TBQ6_9BACT|nr:ATP-binding protein [Chondromyces apiculatus]EYF06255.1 Circadian input kinase A [Chondromyces apiculatus DSM 436]